MAKIKIEKDNVILSIDQEELVQYETRGYRKIGDTKKVSPIDLEKKITKLTKANEELTAKVENTEKEKSDLVKANEELTAKVSELEKKIK